MQLNYLLPARFPTEKAYGHQIASMARAYAPIGVDFCLWRSFPRGDAADARATYALAGLRALGVRGTLIERLPRRGYKKRTFTDDEYRFLLAHLRPEAEALARDGLIDPTLWPTLSS